MTALITGGAGYIGGQVALAFLDRGETPVVLDDLSTGNRSAIPGSVPFFVGDVADTALVHRIIQTHNIDTILHFAAKIVVSDSVADPLAYYLNNTTKTRALLEASVSAGIKRFVFSSTAAVYGNPNKTPVTENVTPAPLSPYGTSKWMSELMLRDVGAAYGLKYVILRYFNVAGADRAGRHGQVSPDATHLIKVAIETALGHRPYMSVYGTDYPTADGTCVRDYVHVADLAAAHLVALDYLQQGGSSRTINCGYGRGYSVREVIEAVKHVASTNFEVHDTTRRAGDPASIIASNDELVNLGWKAKWNDLSIIVQDALAWEKSRASVK